MVMDQQTKGCAYQQLTFTCSACELQLKVFQNTTPAHVALWQVENTVAQWLTGIMITWLSFWRWGTLEWERQLSSTGIPTTSLTASSRPQWASTSEKNEWWVMQRLLACKSKYSAKSVMHGFQKHIDCFCLDVHRDRCWWDDWAELQDSSPALGHSRAGKVT